MSASFSSKTLQESIQCLDQSGRESTTLIFFFGVLSKMALREPVGQRANDTECLTFVFWYPILFAVTLLYVCSCFVLSIFVDIYVFVSYPYFSAFLVFAAGSSYSAPLTSLVGRNSPIRSARDPSNGSKNKKIRQGKNKKENKSRERNVFNRIRSLNFSSIPSILQIDQNISLQIPPGKVLLVSLWKTHFKVFDSWSKWEYVIFRLSTSQPSWKSV